MRVSKVLLQIITFEQVTVDQSMPNKTEDYAIRIFSLESRLNSQLPLTKFR